MQKHVSGAVVALMGTALVAAPPAVADPPGPGEPGYCGAHTSPFDCWADTSPATPGESAFIERMRGKIPGNDARLLQIARGTCGLLEGGAANWYVEQHLAEKMGVNEGIGSATMTTALNYACPYLSLGPDGVARRAG